MSGFEFASRVRKLEQVYQRSPCRIFGYTANLDVEVLLESKRAGMDDCFAKPIKINDLKNCVSQRDFNQVEVENSEHLFDYCSLVALFNGNKTVALSLCNELYESNKVDLKRLNEAHTLGDASIIQHIVHRFAGGARLVSANKLNTEIEVFMQQSTHEGARGNLKLSVMSVCNEVIKLQDYLRTILDSNSAEDFGDGKNNNS
jgi:two-component system sensor histidine kinase EvgS